MSFIGVEDEPAGGIQGMVNSIQKKWNSSKARSTYLSSKSWGWWAFKKGGALTWILGTTLIIVGFPLVLQIEREQQLIEMEQQQMNQGYGAPQYGMPPLQQQPAPAAK
mmetsp:Transcript_17575/g.21630  ORF Transcript_17575/g.21630 Transcript_17575/m.21630 type:complete len:108 (-) Transcript_17575:1684-2007(-)